MKPIGYFMAAALAFGLLAGTAAAQTTIRIAWYSDADEDDVLRNLLDRFEEANPDVDIAVDVVAYQSIVERLPAQLSAGEGPDIARVTDLGGLARHYLDLRPYLDDPAYWDENFAPFLPWLRVPGDEASINGFLVQLSVTGPYVNRTLFDQAGIELPGAGATWDDWAAAANAVADATDVPIPIAMDRSGHRLSGPAISMGARYFDGDGNPAVIDDGFRAMAQRIVQWHQDGTMAPALWGSVTGNAYLGANDYFAAGQVVMYLTGSWQIPHFSETIGDTFDWWAVPNPCGAGGCTGMPGGAALVALNGTDHPEEVARVMDYLASEQAMAEFAGRTLIVPGHLGLSRSGIDFDTDDPLALHALETFSGGVADFSPVAFRLQGYPFNRVIFSAIISRLGQTVIGEMTLDEAYRRIEQDIERQIAERTR